MTRFRGNWETGERRNFRRILVVGGGRAGVAAAEELRRQGYGGEVVVMCDEPDAPYDRPSCSKGLLSGKKRPRDAKMPVQEDLAITWEMGRQAIHLDPQRRVVTADNDKEYKYDGLVIASGSRPLWPKGWPEGEPGLHQLYGLQDAWQLRRALYRAKRVAIVGGGLTGCEVACTVRSLARDCVLIDSKQQVMSRAIGDVAGRYVTEEVAKDGVALRLGRRVQRVDRSRKGWVVTLDDGSEEVADLVVATIGDRPDVSWLESAGFDISDGVLCDENLRVVGGEDVVACGTVARWPNLRYSPEPRRVGQWIMALEQGRAAASALLRSDHPSRPAALVPRYWSEQFGLRIQVIGDLPSDGSAEMTVTRQRPGRKDTARGGVLINYYRDGEELAVVGVNAVRAFTDAARALLATPPKLVNPEPVYSGPPMLAAAPASAPERPGGRLAIGAGPAGPPTPANLPAMAGLARDRHVIDAPPDAVNHHGYGPVPGDEPYPPASGYGYPPESYDQPGYDPRYGMPGNGFDPGGYYPEGYSAGGMGPTGYAPEYGQPEYGPPENGVPEYGYEPNGYAYNGYEPAGYEPGYDPRGYEPGYEPGYGPHGYEPGYDAGGYEPGGYQPDGYGNPGPAYPGQDYPPYPEPGYRQPGYAAPVPEYAREYATAEYDRPAYGPPEYGPPEYGPPGYGRPEYGPPASGPMPEYGQDRYAPADYRYEQRALPSAPIAEYEPPPGPHRSGRPPRHSYEPRSRRTEERPRPGPRHSYEPPAYPDSTPPDRSPDQFDYERMPPSGQQPYDDYGPLSPEFDYSSPAPISPRPVSPPPRINPRDRFATDQFAAVR